MAPRVKAALTSRPAYVVYSLVAGIVGILLVQTIQHLKNDHDNLHVLVQDYVQRHAGGR